MSRTKWLELLLVLLSLFIFVGYNVFLFWGRKVMCRLRNMKSKHEGVFESAQEARLVWTYVVTQDKTESGIATIQTLRNSIMSASLLATTCGLMATSGLLNILTDALRIRWVASLGDSDPIGKAGTEGLISTQWKVATAEFVLLTSFLFFLQAIRLWMFLGYFVRVTQSKENKHNRFPIEVTIAVARRAGHCWSAGCRIFVAVIPLIMWLMGPTALLVVSILVVVFQAFTDFIQVGDVSSITGDPDALYEEEQRVEQEQKVQTEQRGAKRSRARHGRAVNHLSSPPASDSVTHVTAL